MIKFVLKFTFPQQNQKKNTFAPLSQDYELRIKVDQMLWGMQDLENLKIVFNQAWCCEWSQFAEIGKIIQP